MTDLKHGNLRVNRTWRFKGVNCTRNLRVNQTWQFERGKSYRRFEGRSDKYDLAPLQIAKSDLPLKLPKNLIFPQIGEYDLPPP